MVLPLRILMPPVNGELNTKIENPHRGTFQFALGGYFNLSQRVDSSGTVENQKFDNIPDLKKIIISDHQRIAYSFIKKFFEYANGYQPSLSERLDLFALIPNNPKNCKTKDLITEVLMCSLKNSKDEKYLNRKDFLKLGTALPLSLGPLGLNAASNKKEPPKRIIFINNSLGFYEPYFFPKKQGDLTSSDYLKNFQSQKQINGFKTFPVQVWKQVTMTLKNHF